MALVAIPTNELNEFDLPRVCVVTGSTEGVTFRDVKFSWYPRWISVFVVFALLIALILMVAMTKRVKGQLPFTDQGYARWRRARVLRALAILAAIGGIVGTLALFVASELVAGWMALLLTVVIPAVVFSSTRKSVLTCQRIADGHITLKLPSEAAADAINARLHAGLVPPPATRAVAG